MNSGGTQGGLLVVLVAGGLLAVASLGQAGAGSQVAAGEKRGLPTVLSAGQLANMAGGFAPALADIYWIRTISTSDTALDSAGGADRAHALLDRVTALDPKFEPAYHYGALIIGIRAQRPDLADQLLIRAEQAFPDNWKFPFYRGFLRLYHMHDLDEAAGYMERAATFSDSPPFLPALARRLRAQKDDPRMAIELIERMLQATDDEALKQRMRARRDALRAHMQESAS